MRAAVLERFGEPLIEVDVELAGIAPDEVLVRSSRPASATATAPSTWAPRTGRCRWCSGTSRPAGGAGRLGSDDVRAG